MSTRLRTLAIGAATDGHHRIEFCRTPCRQERGEDADQAGAACGQRNQARFEADHEHRRAIRIARHELPEHEKAGGKQRTEQGAEKADDGALEQEDAPHLRLGCPHRTQDADFLAALDDRYHQHARDAKSDRKRNEKTDHVARNTLRTEGRDELRVRLDPGIRRQPRFGSNALSQFFGEIEVVQGQVDA